jgi:hypothetical protein
MVKLTRRKKTNQRKRMVVSGKLELGAGGSNTWPEMKEYRA